MLLCRSLLTLPVLLALLGCAATGAEARTSRSASNPAKGPGGSAKDGDSEDPADKLKKKERELAYARLELEIAKMSTASEEREAANAVQEAQQKLDLARKDRDNFKNVDKPVKIGEKQLDLDRAAWRMEEGRQELDELKAMYKQEELATPTKELVIQRSEKNLAFAKRAVDLQQKEFAELQDHELAKKEKEFDQAVEKAEKALQEANAKKERVASEIKLKQMKAEHHADELEAELAKLKSKAEKGDKKEARS